MSILIRFSLMLLLGGMMPASLCAAEPAPAAAPATTAQTATSTTVTTEERRTPKATVLQRFEQGGLTMWVLLALSVTALTCLLERSVHLRRGQVVPAGLTDQARKLWSQGEFTQLERLDQTRPSVLAGAIVLIARHRHLLKTEVTQLAADDVSRVMRMHLSRAYPLAVVATLAPLLGLFGTVTGMIDSFEVVAIAGSLGDASLLAGGISKALVTTAFGLAVSIPALGAYHWCRQRTNRLALEVEEELTGLLGTWFNAPAPAATVI